MAKSKATKFIPLFLPESGGLIRALVHFVLILGMAGSRAAAAPFGTWKARCPSDLSHGCTSWNLDPGLPGWASAFSQAAPRLADPDPGSVSLQPHRLLSALFQLFKALAAPHGLLRVAFLSARLLEH